MSSVVGSAVDKLERTAEALRLYFQGKTLTLLRCYILSFFLFFSFFYQKKKPKTHNKTDTYTHVQISVGLN